MSDATYFRIPASALAALGALHAGPVSALSPLRAGAWADTPAPERDALQAAGLCDAAGQLAPSARPAVATLAAAASFVRVYLSGGVSVDESVVYRSPDGATVGVGNLDGFLDIESPAPVPVIASMVAQTMGGSVFRSCAFEARLTGEQAVTLAAALDVRRRELLAALAAGSEPGSGAVAAEAVAALCAARPEGNQTLVGVMLDLADAPGLDAATVTRCLSELAAAGHLASAPGGWTLAGEAAALARRMLVLDAAVTVTAGAADASSSVSVAGFTALQAGVHDVLYIETADDGVTLRAESAAGVVGMVEALLADPAAALGEGATSPVAASPAGERQRFCLRCGTPRTGDERFCMNCGASL